MPMQVITAPPPPRRIRIRQPRDSTMSTLAQLLMYGMDRWDQRDLMAMSHENAMEMMKANQAFQENLAQETRAFQREMAQLARTDPETLAQVDALTAQTEALRTAMERGELTAKEARQQELAQFAITGAGLEQAAAGTEAEMGQRAKISEFEQLMQQRSDLMTNLTTSLEKTPAFLRHDKAIDDLDAVLKSMIEDLSYPSTPIRRKAAIETARGLNTILRHGDFPSSMKRKASIEEALGVISPWLSGSMPSSIAEEVAPFIEAPEMVRQRAMLPYEQKKLRIQRKALQGLEGSEFLFDEPPVIVPELQEPTMQVPETETPLLPVPPVELFVPEIIDEPIEGPVGLAPLSDQSIGEQLALRELIRERLALQGLVA